MCIVWLNNYSVINFIKINIKFINFCWERVTISVGLVLYIVINMNIVFRSLKLTLLCLGVNSGYSSHLIKFGDWFNISSFVERINTRTQGVVIDINDNGNYNVFEVNNRRCFFETIRG